MSTSRRTADSLYENDAPFAATPIADAGFYDVERVKVLSGAQGTLYGRNATGGVFNTIASKPTRKRGNGAGSGDRTRITSLEVWCLSFALGEIKRYSTIFSRGGLRRLTLRYPLFLYSVIAR